jgi:hypothetical protein
VAVIVLAVVVFLAGRTIAGMAKRRTADLSRQLRTGTPAPADTDAA